MDIHAEFGAGMLLYEGLRRMGIPSKAMICSVAVHRQPDGWMDIDIRCKVYVVDLAVARGTLPQADAPKVPKLKLPKGNPMKRDIESRGE